MANKHIKKKQTKASILREQYSKEYNKYLARVRNQQKQGVQVQRIKRVKKPSQASIERLKKQTAKEIRDKASVVNMLTGELITSKEYGRKHALEINRVFTKLTPQEQNIVNYIDHHPKEVMTLNAKELSEKIFVSPPTMNRFIKKLGFSGYFDFQLTFIQEQNMAAETKHKRINPAW